MLNWIKNFVKILFAMIFLWAMYFFVYANFHKVDNNIYRSSQLFGFNMKYYIDKYHIKSILNLRDDIDNSMYRNEVAFSKIEHISYYPFGIDDRKIVSKEKMNKIVEILKNAPKPLLIHCKMGADRTSLAVALYLESIKKDKNPKRGFSLLYGHFPYFGSKTIAMDKSFDNFIAK